MESIKDTFISSTFWTESLGPTAALKTLEIMERKKNLDIYNSTWKIYNPEMEKISRKE